jgi:hypothetical protein
VTLPAETAPSYTWPVQNILTNGDFESWASGSDADNWTESGTITQLSATGQSGDGCEIDPSSKVYQIVGLTETASAYLGRNIDDEKPLMLRFYAKPHSSESTFVWKVRVHLLDDTDAEKYVYDWFQTKWVKEETSFGGAYWSGRLLAGDGWTHITLPWIQAVTAAGSDVDSDDWKVRVSFECAASQGIQIDTVELTEWPDIVSVSLGSSIIVSNGLHYPVRYDPRSGLIVEASLPKPYETDNSPIPTVTQGTTGNLSQVKWYAWAWTFWDEELREESGAGYSPMGDTGLITDLMSGSNDSASIDFSTIKIPNSQADPSTDYAQVGKILVFRTVGHNSLAELEAAIAGAQLFYEGSVAVGGTFSSTIADANFTDPAGFLGDVSMFTHLPCPAFTIAERFNNRIYVSGGPTMRRGAASPVALGSNRVVGNTTSSPYSYWGRWADRMYLQFDGEPERYAITRFAYKDDNTTSGEDEFYLNEAYRGSNSGPTEYRVYPESGRIWYCEEGQPTEWSADNWFSLEGAEGEPVTLLQASGDVLVACTRSRTFVYQENSGQQYATSASNDVGCIASKSGAEVRGTAFWLSDYGVIRRRQGQAPEIVSNQIQGMFTDPDDPNYVRRDPITRMASAARGVDYQARQQYLLAVKTVNAKIGCDLVLAFNYFFNTWDIFYLRAELVEWGWTVDDEGNRALLFTDAFGMVNVWDRGTTDGAGDNQGGGMLVAQVESATDVSIVVDSTNAVFRTDDAGSLRGAPCVITHGPGAGQWRTICRNDTGAIYFNEPFATTPTSASRIAIGSIEFEWNGKDSDLGLPTRVKEVRAINIDHKVEGQGGLAEVRVFEDFSTVARSESAEADDGTIGVAVPTFDTAGGARGHVSGQTANGYTLRVQIRHDGPEKPLTIRRLAATINIRDED